MNLDFKDVCKWTLSANEIKTFCDCPRKRYYSSRDCLAIRSSKPTDALAIGDAFHKYLQEAYTQGNEIYNSEQFQFDLRVTGNDEDYQLYSDICNLPIKIDSSRLTEPNLKTLENMIALYRPVISQDLQQFEVIGCEQAFQLQHWPVNDVLYHGFVDMIVQEYETGKVYFFEHKTCRDFRPEIYNRFDIQLHIYSIYGKQTYGDNFGGIFLNSVKKSATPRGFDTERKLYAFDDKELEDFTQWLKAKTEALISPGNNHAPCNDYMHCKMCEYSHICLKYGYSAPRSAKEILNDVELIGDVNNPDFIYNPREEVEDNV